MKAKISKRGEELLKNAGASYALVQAIMDNPDQFSKGEPISFQVEELKNNQKVIKTFSVKKVTD